jgi:hypothetical protein
VNRLYFGDNLDILREHVADDSVDLIYLDPPFNSKRDYNLLFKTPKGHEAGTTQNATNGICSPCGTQTGGKGCGICRTSSPGSLTPCQSPPTPPTPAVSPSAQCKEMDEVIAQDRKQLDSANQHLRTADCVEAARLRCMQNIKEIEEKLAHDAQAAKAQHCPE